MLFKQVPMWLKQLLWVAVLGWGAIALLVLVSVAIKNPTAKPLLLRIGWVALSGYGWFSLLGRRPRRGGSASAAPALSSVRTTP